MLKMIEMIKVITTKFKDNELQGTDDCLITLDTYHRIAESIPTKQIQLDGTIESPEFHSNGQLKRLVSMRANGKYEEIRTFIKTKVNP
jgi:hypothetical protein